MHLVVTTGVVPLDLLHCKWSGKVLISTSIELEWKCQSLSKWIFKLANNTLQCGYKLNEILHSFSFSL